MRCEWVSILPNRNDIVILASDEILIEAEVNGEIEAALEQLRSGAEVEPLLNRPGKVLQLSTIVSIEYNMSNGYICIGTKTGDQFGFEGIYMDNSAAAELYELLATPEFSRKEKRYNPVKAAFTPLLSIGMTLLVTWFMKSVAEEFQSEEHLEIHGNRVLIKRAFAFVVGMIGPNGMCALGAAVLIALSIWLVVRVRNPPRLRSAKR